MRLLLPALLLAALFSSAQSGAPKPEFAAASIRLDPKADGSDSNNGPGLLRAQMPLRRFIAYAYNVKPYQVSGGPNWADVEHYVILAKLEHGGEEMQPRDTPTMQSATTEQARLGEALQ